MYRTRKLLTQAFLSLFLWGSLLDPSSISANTASMQCGPDCNCGCLEGNPCNCNHTLQEDCCDEVATPCCPKKPWIGSDQVYEGPDSLFARAYGARGLWFPEDPPLFRPFMADPRQICYSAGWRFNDQVLNKNVIDVSYGDSLPIYRWFDVWPWCGDLQFDVQGALWAVFDPLHESSPLIDADYYIGFPLTYAVGNWSFRLRGYHISTHIGDEFLINHLDLIEETQALNLSIFLYQTNLPMIFDSTGE